jgi:Tfp pilus tip-associated adhesin PilY1
MSRERRRHTCCSLLPAVLLLALGMLLWTPARPAWSDDRDLLRQSAGNPYVFVILDTTGSMSEMPGTTTESFMGGDDPASKLYGAKQALYQVMTQFTDISYGFATLPNDNALRVFRKHWIYMPNAAPSWNATLGYPIAAQGYTFGYGGTATSPDIQFTCTSPAALPASAGNFKTLIDNPQTGDLGNLTYGVWLSQGGRIYYVETLLTNGSKLGDPTVSVSTRRRRLATGSNRCGSNPPTNSNFDETLGFFTVTYTLVSDALLSDQIDDSTSTANSGSNDNWCTGVEPNTDTASDTYKITSVTPNVTVNLRYPTTSNPSFVGNALFDEGDFLPLNWTKDNKDEILNRLAPNLRLGESTPDFRVARYFQDNFTGTTASGSYALQLKNTAVHPFIAGGNTPLGNSLQNFRSWYSGCVTGVCGKNLGWASVAAKSDPNWACRKKYVLVLTDGDETCGNAAGACTTATALQSTDGVTIFVIGFGVASGSSNTMTCMAKNGSPGLTGVPVYPQDTSALLQALKDIFGKIQEDNRAFASAAVPAVETDVEDKIYLSNFTPLQGDAYWDGHLDAYLKPLPLLNGQPNKTLNCTSTLTIGCHLWDAGVQIKLQAPSTTDLGSTPPNFQIGSGTTQRRVYYTQAPATAAVPLAKKLLLPATTTADKQDLYAGMGVPVPPDMTNVAAVAAADASVVTILKSTYKVKTDSATSSAGVTTTLNFLLDDIFHSNPLIISSPSRSIYYNANLNTKNVNCTAGDPGYKCFAIKHHLRRKMLAVGDNDQQLHIFDAGIFDTTSLLFGNGTGNEIYSLVPRPLLSNLQVLSTDTNQHYGVDGSPQSDDVFIDPSHNGTPTSTDREWRTVVVGGFREGGNGYVAVDVTQPDTINSGLVPQPTSGWIPSCWNGGSGCGTIPFGSVLWTYTDTTDQETTGGVTGGTSAPNGHADLGQTWSSPAIGRILVKTSATPPVLQDRYVAIFGGGMDPLNLNLQGNWLYMVDIETGKAIYKRQLDGSAPSDVAAVDTDLDGYIDTIYIGTTAGSLYKANVRSAGTIVLNAVTGDKITDTAWDPFKIFDTLQTGTTKRGPIFFPPSVIFVPQVGKYALAFGTGNRWNLWAEDAIPGRLYVILDDNFATGVTPKNESMYKDVTSLAAAPSNLLLSPPTGFLPGWFLQLDTEERMITKPFTLAGLTVFTSYDPTITIAGAVCAKSGTSNIFKVYTATGDAVCPTTTACQDSDPGCMSGRCAQKPDFVTSPFVESSATKNPPCDPTKDANCAPPPPLCSNLSNVTKTLMALFPSNCQFASFTQDIKTIQSNNGIVCIAPVPVCVIRKNWKEN